jgi:hypothetical protein
MANNGNGFLMTKKEALIYEFNDRIQSINRTYTKNSCIVMEILGNGGLIFSDIQKIYKEMIR